MHVAYLRLAEPRESRDAFAGWRARARQDIRHRPRSADAQFWDTVSALTYEGDLRDLAVSAADVEQVDPDRAYSIWREHLSSFNGATFFVVGDAQLDRLKPLVETYLASLPSGDGVAIPKAPPPQYPTEKVERTVVAGREPHSKVLLQFIAPDYFDIDLETDLEIFEDALRMRLKQVLRDQLGDVYTLSVSAWWAREPEVHHDLQIWFDCAPENVDRLTKAVFDELAALGRSGIGDDYVEALKLRIFRQYAVQRSDVNWWLEKLKAMYVYGDELSKTNDANDAVERVTSANVSATARRLFDEKRYVRVVLRPEALAGTRP